MSVAGVLNEPCRVWFAVVGVRVGMSFLGVLHSVRMVLLRFGDVSGCAEWAVPIVICCWWCEFWRWREIRFFCVPAVMAWVLGRWREIRLPPSSLLMFITRLSVDGNLPLCNLWSLLGSANNQEVAWDWIIDFPANKRLSSSQTNDWNESNRWKVDLEVAHQGGRF